MRELLIDERRFSDPGELHEHLKRSLDFPPYYGANLAALSDCLGEVDEPTRIVVRRAGKTAQAERAAMERIEAASRGEERAPEGWFDKVCMVLERESRDSDLLDVIVYFDDLFNDELDGISRLDATSALRRLKRGNIDYLTARVGETDVSLGRIRELYEGGQQPFATIVTCSDSRVVPEHIFMAGLGDLFIVRVAGNVIGEAELASIIYSCSHLATRLLLVLGHTHCGAIEAAMAPPSGDEEEKALSPLIDPIRHAIGEERDPYAASLLNVRASMSVLRRSRELKELMDKIGLEIHGAVYHTRSGVVDFLDYQE